jgi:hypothetical protein
MEIQRLRQFLKKHNLQSSINSNADLLELTQKESLTRKNTALVDTGNCRLEAFSAHYENESSHEWFLRTIESRAIIDRLYNQQCFSKLI